MNSEKLETRFSIDMVLECARGVSALWVFMFHISDAFETSAPFLYTIAKYGYQGVPIFFVISGYCIYSAAEKTLSNDQRPNTFLIRRLLRVMPPFWASIIVVIALPFLLEAISSIKSGVYVSPSPRWLQFTSVEWIEIVTLTRELFSGHGDLQGGFSAINAVYWSLAIEVQLYFAMYAALYFKSNWRKFLIALLGVSILTCAIPAMNRSGLFLEFWPAFFMGLSLRWAHQRGITPLLIFGKNQLWASCLAAGTLFFAISVFMFSPLHTVSVLPAQVQNANFIATSVFATALLWLLGGIEHGVIHLKNYQTENSKLTHTLLLPLCWVGQSSYSLYLLHGKLYNLPSMFIRQIVSPDNVLHPLLTMVATALLCFGFYKLVEVPSQRIGRTIADRALRNRSVSESLNVGQV
jgi:peptidoglycan/LPS O-acetylase OafA/YrhL